MKKFSSWAKENNVNYHTAYYWYKNNKLPENVIVKPNPGGSLYVMDANAKVEEKQESILSKVKDSNEDSSFIEPKMTSFASDDPVRRNRAATIIRTDQYTNIDKGILPFNTRGKHNNQNNININDIIILCQKAYYNFAIFRNVIDLMTEFTVSEIYFKGGNEKARAFFKSFFSKIDMFDLQDRFFREYFRSGNVFVHRLDSLLKPADVRQITTIYGEEGVIKEDGVRLPANYIILNPADIQAFGSVSYVNSQYAKVLNPYEIERLKNPKTDDEIELFNGLPDDVKTKIKNATTTEIAIPLDQEKISAVFYKKQDYEPMAVPLGYPVLRDINWKEELKNIDSAISRTIQQVVLLINVGQELKDGTVHINQKQINTINEMFQNESVGRVFVADFTTKAQFVIPQIGDILDPKKYEVVNEDIRLGLNNILVGDAKFANQQVATKVFIERLKHARMAFKSQFLIPEIKRISKILGFKNFPTPYFTGFSLDDKVEWARIYNRLAEVGILTAEETVRAIEDGRLPNPEESVASQEEYKKHRDKELYTPLIGGGNKDQQSVAGRPAGTKKPIKTKKVGPVGASEKDATYSASKLKDLIISSANVNNKVISKVKDKYQIKELLNDKQLEICEDITNVILANENPEEWLNKVDEYVENPVDRNSDQVNKINSLMVSHGINQFMATLMFHSQKE